MQLQLEEEQPKEQTKIELLPIDVKKSFGVLMKEGLLLGLTGNWQFCGFFQMDDYDKCNCMVSCDEKFLKNVNQIYTVIRNATEKLDGVEVSVLQPSKDKMIKLGLPRSSGIVKNVRVENSKDKSWESVAWEKIRHIQPKTAAVKVNCYYQNRDGRTTIGFFYQLEKLII